MQKNKGNIDLGKIKSFWTVLLLILCKVLYVRKQVMNIEDYILIRRIQNGDPGAFETLVRKHYQNIYQFCVRRCNGDTALAADLTQDTFLKLIEHIQQYRLTGKFINFLLTIAVNTCNNHFKKKSPDIVDMDTLSAVPSNLNISEEVLRQEDAKIIQQAIDRLPDIQKEVVILRFYHDRKLKEIAAITGVSLPTAKSRLKQGLDKLKRYLDKEDFKA